MEQAKRMMNQWLQHRQVLEQLILLIPDEHIHLKPWNGAMALGELAQHIAGSTDMFLNIVMTGQRQISMPPIADCKTMAEVYEIVHNLTEKSAATFAQITDTELAIEYDSPHPNLRGPRLKLLTIAIDHEIHHKGQLFVYARMAGLTELPFFI